MNGNIEFFLLWFLQIMQAGVYGVICVTILTPRWEFPRGVMLLIPMVMSAAPVYLKITTPVRDWKNVLSLVLINAVILLYMLVWYKDRLSKRIIIYLTVISISLLSELMLYFFVDSAKYLSSDITMLSSGWLLSLIGFCIFLVFTGILLLLYTLFAEKIQFPVSNFVIFLFFPVSQIMCYFLINREYQLEKDKLLYHNPLILVMIPVGIVGSLSILYIMVRQAKQDEIRRKYLEMVHLWDNEKVRFEALEGRAHEYDKIKHDLMNQINMITLLIGEKNYSEAETVAGELRKRLDVSAGDGKKYCINPVINALMVEKAEECRKNSIILTTDISVGELRHISLLHQCSLFSNLLDNAIHAATMFEGRRYIRLEHL